MAAVRRSHGSNVGGVTGSREPVVDRSPDPPPLQRRFARALVAGDQKHEAVSTRDSFVEAAVNRSPGGIQIKAMEVDDAIQRSGPAAQLLVPAAIESLFSDGNSTRAADWR